MNLITRKSSLALAALALVCFAVPARAGALPGSDLQNLGAHARPFKLRGAGSLSVGENGIMVAFSGKATHLGKYDAEGTVVRFIPGPVIMVTIQGAFTGANGDTIMWEAEGSIDPSSGTGMMAFTFTGGTGRFEGASGGGLSIFSFNLVDGSFVLSLRGNILFNPGDPRRVDVGE